MQVSPLGFVQNPFQQKGNLSDSNRQKLEELKAKLEEITA